MTKLPDSPNADGDNKPNTDQIPEALLKKLWNHTGDGEHYQGFYLIYINKEGEPIINARAQNSATDIVLRYAIEQMVDNGIDETFDEDDNSGQ